MQSVHFRRGSEVSQEVLQDAVYPTLAEFLGFWYIRSRRTCMINSSGSQERAGGAFVRRLG